MANKLIGYATKIVINGDASRRHGDYMDWYENDAAAISATKEFFAAQGFNVLSVEIKQLKRFDSSPAPTPTVCVELTTKK